MSRGPDRKESTSRKVLDLDRLENILTGAKEIFLAPLDFIEINQREYAFEQTEQGQAQQDINPEMMRTSREIIYEFIGAGKINQENLRNGTLRVLMYSCLDQWEKQYKSSLLYKKLAESQEYAKRRKEPAYIDIHNVASFVSDMLLDELEEQIEKYVARRTSN
jgi:hypothetical protein